MSVKFPCLLLPISGALVRNNPAALLATVLLSEKCKINQISCCGVSDDTGNSALFM
jgi:hypothetical protein